LNWRVYHRERGVGLKDLGGGVAAGLRASCDAQEVEEVSGEVKEAM